MRVSARKVVKYSTFLLFLLILNVYVSYNVNLWSFHKLQKSLDNNGELGQSKVNVKTRTIFGVGPQRRAKSISTYDDGSFESVESDLFPERNKNIDLAFHRNNPPPQQQVVPQSETDKQVQQMMQSNNTPNKPTELDDVFISVKTTLKYHHSRVKLLLKTWYGLAAQQTFFFSDGEDPNLQSVLGNQYVNTNCSTDHSRRSLSCKMASEFDAFMVSRKRWLCHVDDDVYVNVPQLVELLRRYNHREDWYLGKASLRHPLEVADRENPGMKLTFWFATGGAGFCLSRSLALKMAPHAGGGRFMTTAEKIRLPDDCTIGYIVEHVLRQKLTIIPEFHSHLENLWLIKQPSLKKQITFSFSDYSKRKNVVNVPGFSTQKDPTRFKSLHCYLFPNFKECAVLKNKSTPATGRH